MEAGASPAGSLVVTVEDNEARSFDGAGSPRFRTGSEAATRSVTFPKPT